MNEKERRSIDPEEVTITRTRDVSSPLTEIISTRFDEIHQPDVVGDQSRAQRQERKGLMDQEWVSRIVQSQEQAAVPPEGYVWHASLQQELAELAPEGVTHYRKEEAPPPPVMTIKGAATVPTHVFASGIKWSVGAQVGKGGFGTVFEIRHEGTQQKQRLVKLMAVDAFDQDASHRRGAIWNEVAAAMASGDYVSDETVIDEQGSLWTALILERHTVVTLHTITHEPFEEGKEQQERIRDVQWTYKQALAMRSVVSALRRMHALGWVHRDIKPANIVANMNDGEESLTRPIDYGMAQRHGAIRRRREAYYSGSPKYLLPEVWIQQDVDLRLRDYWATLLSFGEALELFSIPKLSLAETRRKLTYGQLIQSPDLGHTTTADTFFSEKQIEGAQRSFLEWMYGLVQPHLPVGERLEAWRSQGVTKTLEVPSVDPETIELLNGEEFAEVTRGDFFDDDLFVSTLEQHIRALAQQAGLNAPDEVLQGLQEFSLAQSSDQRILHADEGGSQQKTNKAA